MPLTRLSSLIRRPRGPERMWRDPASAAGPYDVAVVGGGVRALGVARACAAEGARVAVFAPGEIAAAADERAWPVLRAATPDLRRALTDAASPQLVRRHGRGAAGVNRAGCLTIASSAQDRDVLSASLAALKAQGVDAWMVPAREVAALSPPLAGLPRSSAALYEPGADVVDVDALALALAEDAAAAGAELFAQAPASALDREQDKASGLRFKDTVISAGTIVLADDVSAIRLVREGMGRLSLVRDERVILVTAGDAPSIGPALAIGELRISRDRAGAITASGPFGTDAIARDFVKVAPALADLAVASQEPVTVWRGVDGLAQVGPAEIAGLWLALGFGRDALSLALPAAECLAAQIAGRRTARGFAPLAPTRQPARRVVETVG